jgi:DNA modification methylase
MPAPVEGTPKIDIVDIIVDAHRKDPGDIQSLAHSLKVNGLINAIVVDRNVNKETGEIKYKLVAGWRRLEAAKSLKWEKIGVHLYENLTPFERKSVEMEEELAQKKTRSWQEEIEIKRQLHELFMEEKGGNEKRKGQRGEKKWTQTDSAERIGVPSSSFSEDLRLAEALKCFPELLKVSSKKDAIRKMYAMRELALLQSVSRKMKDMGVEISEDVELRNGSAYELLKTLPNESFDCCITDPPWGIEIENAGSARSNDYIEFKDTADVWSKFLKEGLPELFRVMKEGSHLWLFFGPEFYKETREALEANGFDVRYVPCIWLKEKPNYTDTEYKPMPTYESFFYAMRRKDKELTPRRLNEATSDVFVYPRNPAGRIHRTEKPIDLLKRLISLSTNKGDKILDPFAGSASLLCAAFLMQRQALGFELDKDMFEAAQGRLQALRMENAELVVEAEAETETEFDSEGEEK